MSDEKEQNNFLELINKDLICYIGKNAFRKKSFDVYNQIQSKEIADIKYSLDGIGELSLGDEKYHFYHPIFEKPIKIIDSSGMEYKSNVYFFEDIQNIISYFKMKNPHYQESETREFYKLEQKEDEYSSFLIGNNDTIKDINYSIVNYAELECIYKKNSEKFKTKGNLNNLEDIKLKYINDNIEYYSDNPLLKYETFYYTKERNSFNDIIKTFYYKKKDKIMSIYGNYASGKTISLIHFNASLSLPSLYMNLKAIKNSFQTSAYTTIFPFEAINMFVKAKKSFEEFKIFIQSIYRNEYISLDEFVITIINFFKEWEGIIFLDQFNHEIFNNESKLIEVLKNSLNNENSKLKILLINSLNDNLMRELYINYVLDIFGEHIPNNGINCIFLKKLITKESSYYNKIDNNLCPYLELFDFIPLYYSLILTNKDNLDKFIEETKIKIGNKIDNFFKSMGTEDNLIKMDEIRAKLDEEIEKTFFEEHKNYIPFKYFYVDTMLVNFDKKAILKCYFPLIKEIWVEKIYEKTLPLFDGEINYKGNTIGSLLELSFIEQCKKNNFSLDIDCNIELDTLEEMKKIIKSTSNDYKNKNIFITQKKENAPYFDVGFLKAKNKEQPQMSYIQVKKSYADNKVNKYATYLTFNGNKEKFKNMFGINPFSCYLIYITLINQSIKKNIYLFSTNKKELDSEKIEAVKKINLLDTFCSKNKIMLYYFNPNSKKFFIRNGSNFTETELDLFSKISEVSSSPEKLKVKFSSIKLRENENYANQYNIKFINKIPMKKEYVLFEKEYKFYFDVVYKFIARNCINGKINSYIFLNKDYDELSYENVKGRLILGFCKDIRTKSFYIKSVIYDNYIINHENVEERVFIESYEIDTSKYDCLVWVDFQDFTTDGKIYKNDYF